MAAGARLGSLCKGRQAAPAAAGEPNSMGGTLAPQGHRGDPMIDIITGEAIGVTSGTLGAAIADWYNGYAYGPVRWDNSNNAPRWGGVAE